MKNKESLGNNIHYSPANPHNEHRILIRQRDTFRQIVEEQQETTNYLRRVIEEQKTKLKQQEEEIGRQEARLEDLLGKLDPSKLSSDPIAILKRLSEERSQIPEEDQLEDLSEEVKRLASLNRALETDNQDYRNKLLDLYRALGPFTDSMELLERISYDWLMKIKPRFENMEKDLTAIVSDCEFSFAIRVEDDYLDFLGDLIQEVPNQGRMITHSGSKRDQDSEDFFFQYLAHAPTYGGNGELIATISITAALYDHEKAEIPELQKKIDRMGESMAEFTAYTLTVLKWCREQQNILNITKP